MDACTKVISCGGRACFSAYCNMATHRCRGMPMRDFTSGLLCLHVCLFQRQHAAIMGLVWSLLAGERRENLSTYCLQLCGTPIHRSLIGFTLETQLNTYTLLIFAILNTLNRFKHSWLTSAQTFGMVYQLTWFYGEKFLACILTPTYHPYYIPPAISLPSWKNCSKQLEFWVSESYSPTQL